MRSFDLKINGLEVYLGMGIDGSIFQIHEFKEIDEYEKQVINPDPDIIIWWSMNCAIRCFEKAIILLPSLDTEQGFDKMYGTSGYLFFKDNSLERVTFQLVDNIDAADQIIDKFNNIALEAFGEPKQEGNLFIWDDGSEILASEKINNSPHAHFHWFYK